MAYVTQDFYSGQKLTDEHLKHIEAGIATADANAERALKIANDLKKLDGGGLSSNAKSLLMTVLRNAVYNSNQVDNLTALEAALAESGSGAKSYVVTYNLTNASYASEMGTIVEEGYNYLATITADRGYVLDSVIVTMGGEDITSAVYSNGVVNIPVVTGAVVITAICVKGVSALHKWDLTKSMVDSVGGVEATTTGTQDENGVTIGAEKQYIDFGLVFDYNRTYELDVANLDTQGGSNTYGRIFVVDNDSETGSRGTGLTRRGTGWDFYTWNTGGWNNITALTSLANNYFSGKKLTIKIDSSGYMTLLVDGEFVATSKNALDTSEFTSAMSHIWVGGSSDYLYNCTISGFRVYDGV